jgi:hypothetical protein
MGRGGKWRGLRKVNMVEVPSLHRWAWNSETCGRQFKKGRGRVIDEMN